MAHRLHLTALVAALAVAGCSTVNPYQRAEQIDHDLTKMPEPAVAWAGGLSDTLRDVNAQRVEWFESLSAHARTANMSSLLIYGLTSWGLYQGLKPGFTSGGTATDGTRRRVAQAGIGAGAAYAVGNLFLNPRHDETYVEGFRSLTCLMARARPYLLTTDDADTLRREAWALEAQLLELDTRAVQWRQGLGIEPDARSNDPDARTLAAAERVLKQSRATLERARALHSRIGTTSFQLRRQADLIVASVSEEIRRNNKGITAPDQFLSSLRAVTGQFQAIQPVKDTSDPDSPGSAASDTGSAGSDDGVVEAGSKSATASPPAGAKKPGDETAKQLATLQSKIEELTKALSAPAAMKDVAIKAVEAKAAKTAKEVEALKRKIADIEREATKRAPRAGRLRPEERIEAGALIARLYAQRRLVNQYLVNHNDQAQRVRNIPECRGATASLLLVPSEDKTVAPGSSYRFQVSGMKGLPLVALDGNPGALADGAKNLVVGIEGGAVVIDVVIALDAPAGTLTLRVTDPGSHAVEDVALTIVRPAKEK